MIELMFVLFGLAAGCLLTHLLYAFKTTSGTIFVNHLDSEGDTLGIKLDRPQDLGAKDRVIFKVSHNELSQQ